MQPKRVIIDTDPGIDDALAILLALASPGICLEGVTVVHGNCSVEQGTTNALSVLELAGRDDIPVAKGCALPLVQPSLLAPETHGLTGLGYARLPDPRKKPLGQHAVHFLIDKILSAPGEISLVSVGPLTNLAMAIRLEPVIVPSVKEVIIMGGAIRFQGNTTALAEFNTYVDPHSAHIVFHSGMPVTLVPLDVTYQCILSPQDVMRLHAHPTPISQFIADATRFYMEFHDEYQQIDGCVINDPLAVAVLDTPDLLCFETHFVDVDLSPGAALGKTYADFYRFLNKPANMRVALGVRGRDFIAHFIHRVDRLCHPVLEGGI